jgi:2-polyprenyl-3-methyl-5-hydroxy-6-metoxy-1,4-benzoquinol methylase
MTQASTVDGHAGGPHGRTRSARIGVLVIAGDAPCSAAALLDAVPERLRARLAAVFLSRGADRPTTGSAERLAVPSGGAPRVIHLAGRGGGGDIQKAAYRLAVEGDLDIVVVLRGPGPYPSGLVESLVAPLERDEFDAVIGTRVPSRNRARGAPIGERIGGRLLAQVDRKLGTQLEDLHSGWRAYRVQALSSIPFEGNAGDDHFDLQVVLQLLGAGKRIAEVPAPGVQEEEVHPADALRRVRDASLDVLRLRLASKGYLSGHLGRIGDEYGLKNAENSSHSIVLRWLGQMPPGRVLDVGCSSGLLAERIRALGHHVTGVDMFALPGVTERVDRFLQADLDRGLPLDIKVEAPFELAVAADVLEHVRDPESLLKQIRSVLIPGGTLIVSVPNFGHWYPRVRTAVGLFDYDQRGILDRGHVRFFTRRGLLDLIRRSGFAVTRQQATGLPVEVLSAGDGLAWRGVRAADRLAVGTWPTLFGYQFVIRCETPAALSWAPAPAG